LDHKSTGHPAIGSIACKRRAVRGGNSTKQTRAQDGRLWRNSVGIRPVYFLKAELNTDFELNPVSYKISRTVLLDKSQSHEQISFDRTEP
jgi:hypothetical protein